MAEYQGVRISAKDVDQQHLVKALAAFLKKYVDFVRLCALLTVPQFIMLLLITKKRK